jgi:hypothetical protein
MTGGRESNHASNARDLTELNEQWRALQSALRPDGFGAHATELSAEVLSQSLSAMAERQREMWQGGLAMVEATYRRNLPENWQSIDSSLLDVLAVVKESGISLIWAPRSELILRLVAATTRADREGLLAAERDVVLADLDTTMRGVGTVELAGFREASAFAQEAIAAAHDGHMTAAQSLAACGLEPAARVAFAIPSLSQVRKQFERRNADEVRATLMKVTLLQMCTAKALAPYDENSLPEGFNRHATNHGERAWFSDANALAGMLLLVGWLREFRWFADHHPEMFRPDT